MASARTTISCRFFAPLLLLLGWAALPGELSKVPAAPVWTVKLPGLPAAPPVIDRDRVYVALDAGGLQAFDAKDGVEVWRRDVRIALPIVADGGRVFAAAESSLSAFNPDGSVAWERAFETLTGPLVAQDGWVILSSATQLLALRASDGSVVWRVPAEGEHERPSIEGDALYVAGTDHRVRALDLANGRERWACGLGGRPTEVLPFPDKVFVGSSDKYFYAIDAKDGEIAWTTRVGAPLRGRPASDGQRVFVLAFDNALRAYDRGNGALRWSPKGVPFRPAAGPIVMAGVVFVAGPATEVRTFDAVTGKPDATIKLPQPLATLPAFADTPGGVVMAAVTGNLTEQWTLALWGSPPQGGPPK